MASFVFEGKSKGETEVVRFGASTITCGRKGFGVVRNPESFKGRPLKLPGPKELASMRLTASQKNGSVSTGGKHP